MDNNLKEKEVVIDIESGEASHGAHTKSGPFSSSKWGKISLNRLVSGILSFNRSGDGEPRVKLDGVSGGPEERPCETTELLVDKNPGGQRSQELVPLVGKDHEKERRKGGKAKKASKPPRPPKGPSLDAADMRLVREISKTAMKKRERMERVKALKKMKSARSLSASSASLSSSSSSLSSSGANISAMFVTVFFFLVLFFQVLGSTTSSNLTLAGAPQLAPETVGLTPMEFYKTVMSDDGAAPSFLPPKSTHWN